MTDRGKQIAPKVSKAWTLILQRSNQILTSSYIGLYHAWVILSNPSNACERAAGGPKTRGAGCQEQPTSYPVLRVI
jgi:hypothetical protein